MVRLASKDFDKVSRVADFFCKESAVRSFNALMGTTKIYFTSTLSNQHIFIYKKTICPPVEVSYKCSMKQMFTVKGIAYSHQPTENYHPTVQVFIFKLIVFLSWPSTLLVSFYSLRTSLTCLLNAKQHQKAETQS